MENRNPRRSCCGLVLDSPGQASAVKDTLPGKPGAGIAKTEGTGSCVTAQSGKAKIGQVNSKSVAAPNRSHRSHSPDRAGRVCLEEKHSREMF